MKTALCVSVLVFSQILVCVFATDTHTNVKIVPAAKLVEVRDLPDFALITCKLLRARYYTKDFFVIL